MFIDQLNILEKYAKEKNIPIMQKEGMDFLLDYIKENKIKNILEIGSAIGYSAIKMALIDQRIQITTIEKDEQRYLEAVNNIKKFNLENQIDIVLGDALDIDVNGKFDLIFIDAAKSQYIKFFEKFKINLNDNGAIISDNLDFHGLVNNIDQIRNRNLKQLVKKISKYILFLKDNQEFKTDFIKLGDGIAISKKINRV